ncbi:segregation/condensation protein A [uncultured Fibrobacter sp.]|uniref:segregation and condensation protein A n=1 Tax=uncultured Fibrobacter sp. TaxID=261512 RepID=UPI00261675B2|nr:segregation/condensation protein A [uncultured Fibrobacter sp.]
MTEVEEQEEYEVRIGAFNGPMDLLVYLVQKKEVPLEQISIAEIADQFLKWVNEYEGTDLSKAGDFLYMASRLMALKVQELLPAEQRDPEMVAEYNEDREQLMKEMLEYQRFKQVASGLQEMEGENFGTYSRGRLEKTQTDEETLADANIWQLFRAYQKSLKTKISETIHHIELDYVTIQDRQQAINNYLSVNGRALFEDLLDNDSHPIVAAVTFMAMLEMIKTDEIVFRQSELFGPIWIYRKKNNADYAEEMAHETVFFSKDPDVKPGLVEAIRNQALARSKEQSVGDLAAVMREAVLWTSRGRNVTEDDLTAMLEGREDLSEVQENPFAEMMKEDDAADGSTGSPTLSATESPTDSTPAENAPVQAENTPTTETIAEATSVSEEAPVEEIVAPVTDVIPAAEPEPPLYNTEDVASVEKEIPDQVGNDNSSVEEPVDESPAEEQQPSDGSNNEPNMTDEEFEAFMKKAQAFYDSQASENSDDSDSSDDDDDFPSIEVHSND